VGGRNSVNIGNGLPSKVGTGSISPSPGFSPDSTALLSEILKKIQGNVATTGPIVTSGSAFNDASQLNAAVLEALKGSGIFNQGGIQGTFSTQSVVTPGSVTFNGVPQLNAGAVLEALKGVGIFNQGGVQGSIAPQPLVTPGQITLDNVMPVEGLLNQGGAFNGGSNYNGGSVSFLPSGGQNGKYLEILPGDNSYEYHVINGNIGSPRSNVVIPNTASFSITPSSIPIRAPAPPADVGGRSSTIIVRQPKVTYSSKPSVTYPTFISKSVTRSEQPMVRYPSVIRPLPTVRNPVRSKTIVTYPAITKAKSFVSYPASIRSSVRFPSRSRIINSGRKISTVGYPESSSFEGDYAVESEVVGDDEGYELVNGAYGSMSGGYDEFSGFTGGSNDEIYVEGYYDSDGRWIEAHYDSYQEYLRHHANK